MQNIYSLAWPFTLCLGVLTHLVVWDSLHAVTMPHAGIQPCSGQLLFRRHLRGPDTSGDVRREVKHIGEKNLPCSFYVAPQHKVFLMQQTYIHTNRGSTATGLILAAAPTGKPTIYMLLSYTLMNHVHSAANITQLQHFLFTKYTWHISLFYNETHASDCMISSADLSSGVTVCQPIIGSGWDQNKWKGLPLYRWCIQWALVHC